MPLDTAKAGMGKLVWRHLDWTPAELEASEGESNSTDIAELLEIASRLGHLDWHREVDQIEGSSQ